MTFQRDRRADPYNPIWTISNLYLPIVGYYDSAKFRVDHFSCSGGVHVGKNPMCSIGTSLATLNYHMSDVANT
jgi:hypothetical protein